MASLMSAKMATRPMRAVAARPARQVARKFVVCKAEQLTTQKLALPLATAVASVMLSGAFFPEEALAASSGGRAGGSSGFASRKASSSRQQTTTTQSTTIVNNYVAPPVYGGYGFGGFSFMPTFFVPIPLGGFGAIFGLFFMVAMLGAVFNVVRSMQESSSSSSSTTTTTTTKKYDSWDD